MTPARRKLLKRLRHMAPVMTQAEAARKLGTHRQRVNRLAQDYGIRFHRRPVAPKPRMCRVCDARVNEVERCLRCKWTPDRVKRLRRRYGLSQIKMSLEVLGMNVWACSRWENVRAHPSRRGLAALERAEQSLKKR